MVVQSDPSQRFINAIVEIAASKDFQQQIDDLLSGKSLSLKIGGGKTAVAEKKLRFFSGEFVDSLKELKSKNPSHEALLNLCSAQIRKGHVVYKEKMTNNDTQYFASPAVLEKIRNGEFSIKSKSGIDKKIAIKGEGGQEGAQVDEKVKEINVTAFDQKVFEEAATQAEETFLEVIHPNKEMKPQTAEKKEAVPSPKPEELAKKEIETEKPPVKKSVDTAVQKTVVAKEEKKREEAHREFQEDKKEKNKLAIEKQQDIERKEIEKQDLRLSQAKTESIKEATEKTDETLKTQVNTEET